ncbi:MAG: YihA family ribosome biogenesis GTP-binding protein [Hyphomicrobiaceae bacterium]
MSTFSAEELAHAAWLFAQPWYFVRGVPTLEFLPEADRSEIAFAGRSNVGKSSLINGLVNQHGLARTSNTPGRTQDLNFFAADPAPFYIVDLPGYGYAKAPKEKVDAWGQVLRDYLRGRVTLRRVFVLIDSRHGIKPVDHEILNLLDEAAVPYQAVLTKIDKIKQPGIPKAIDACEAELKSHGAAFPTALATSTAKSIGIEELRAAVVGAAT